jgi:hypothetical protein
MERWKAEPMRILVIPAHSFIPNAGGYPVLSKSCQNFLKSIFKVGGPHCPRLYRALAQLVPSSSRPSSSLTLSGRCILRAGPTRIRNSESLARSYALDLTSSQHPFPRTQSARADARGAIRRGCLASTWG